MRITQRTIQRNYVNRMNKNMQNLSRSNERMSSQQKYSRMWENTAEVARAYQIREQLNRTEQNLTNVQTAQGELTSAESNMQMLNNIMRNVEDRLLQANTGTVPDNERQMIGRELESLQDQVLQIFNAQFGDKHLFASSGNGKAPFENANGKLTFNGYPVDDLKPDPVTGNPTFEDTSVNPPVWKELNYNKDVYIDIGMGMVVNGSGANAKVDPKSVFRLSTSGLDAFGYGKDAEGIPKNLFSLLQKITGDVKSGNMDEMGKDLGAIKGVYDSLLMSITDVGVRASYLDETWNRMDADTINLKAAQQKLEGAPIEMESIYNKSYEMSWMVTLQLGSKIMPPSIFDFLR